MIDIVSQPKANPPRAPATFADLEALPEDIRGEVIEGTLYTFPRPRNAHQVIAGAVYADLLGPFQRGRGGPGDWWIIIEPGVRLPSAAEFSPDVVGWRRSRMETLPEVFRTVPDWLCEVHSPSTRGYDLVTKRAYYARIGVGHLWYIDPEARSLTVSRLENGHWLELGVFGGDARIRADPFAEVEIAMADWWGDEPAPAETSASTEPDSPP
jgi:Uma2 family endonuclease